MCGHCDQPDSYAADGDRRICLTCGMEGRTSTEETATFIQYSTGHMIVARVDADGNTNIPVEDYEALLLGCGYIREEDGML